MMLNCIRLFLACVFFLLMAEAGVAATVCFKCHERAEFANKVVHEPVASEQCTSCHSPHAARHEGLLQDVGIKLCSRCHADTVEGFQKDFFHQPVKEGKCLACHNPHSSANKGLIRGVQGGDTCFECHVELQPSYDFTHAPYANGQCSACHLPHSADNPSFLRDTAEKLCFTCHKNQEIAKLHNESPVRVERGCLLCHNPHGSSREALIRDVLHAPYEDGCADCHDGSGGPVGVDTCLGCHDEVGEKALSSHSHLTYRAQNVCVNCHSPHASNTKDMLRGSQVVVCRACHDDTFRRFQDKRHKHTATAKACNECHAVHGSNELAMLREEGNAVCSRCHESQGVFSHPVGDRIRDPRNGQRMDCVSCHNPHGTDYKMNLKLDGQEALCKSCHTY